MILPDFIKDLYATLFPRPCVSCGTLLMYEEKNICINCLNQLPFLNISEIDNNIIEDKLKAKVDIQHASSLFVYQRNTENNPLIHHLKFKQRYDIGIYLGEIAGNDIRKSGRFENIDYLIPVPITKHSLKTRGYNQTNAICEGINKVLDIPVIYDVLVRKREGVKQSSLPLKQREENANNAYEIKNYKDLENKNILIVDDIITSGSTMVSCIKTLQQIENVNIYVYSLAAVV